MEITKEELDKKIADAIGPIKAKNTELLGKLKGLKQFDGIDLEELQTAANELKQLKEDGEKESGKWEGLYNTLKAKTEKDAADLTALNVSLQAEFDASTLKNSVTVGLMGLDIIPELSEVAIATLMSQASLNEDKAVVFGDKSSEDFMKKWADSPVGKHMIKSGNTGGGGGGSENDALKTEYEAHFKPGTVNMTKQLELKNSKPEVFKVLDDQYNPKKPLPSHSSGGI